MRDVWPDYSDKFAAERVLAAVKEGDFQPALDHLCDVIDRAAADEDVFSSGRLEYAHRSIGQRFRRLRESLLAAGPR